MTKALTELSVIALLFAGNVPAQQQEASAQGWNNLIQLAPGAPVRVALAGGRTVRGDLQKVTSDSLTVSENGNQQNLPRTEIGRVQLKRKGHRGRNALIGLAIGAGGGLAIGAASDRHDSHEAFNFFPNAGKVVLTPLGAIVGAAVGAVIPTGGWREIYRAP